MPPQECGIKNELRTIATSCRAGILGEMNAKLLQKVEELTLYVIDLQK